MYAYGYLKSEIGVHRLVRILWFECTRRPICFCARDSDIDDSIDIKIVDSELRIDTYRASGAGVSMSIPPILRFGLRISHQYCSDLSNERSQHKNKDRPWSFSKDAYQHEMEKRRQEAMSTGDEKKTEWGSQIRNYVLHPYKLVKDMRTGHESYNVDKVFSGELTPFMESWLSLDEQKEGEVWCCCLWDLLVVLHPLFPCWKGRWLQKDTILAVIFLDIRRLVLIMKEHSWSTSPLTKKRLAKQWLPSWDDNRPHWPEYSLWARFM